jgi:hypothetical protein
MIQKQAAETKGDEQDADGDEMKAVSLHLRYNAFFA